MGACTMTSREQRTKRFANELSLSCERDRCLCPAAVPWYLRHQLRAMRTALGGNRDFAQALRAGLGGGCWNHLGFKFVHQCIDWQHHQKVHRGGDDQKRDRRVEEVAVLDSAAVDMEDQERKVRLADDRRNQWVDNVGHQGVDDRRKSGADHNSYGKIDHIATQDEIAKSFKHFFLRKGGNLFGRSAREFYFSTSRYPPPNVFLSLRCMKQGYRGGLQEP